MDKAIAMQVIFWWFIATAGKWLVVSGLRKSSWGTRYKTETDCKACRAECKQTRREQKDITLLELRRIRVLLIQVALRQGVDVENLEEIIG
jgi:hypothetical protein